MSSSHCNEVRLRKLSTRHSGSKTAPSSRACPTAEKRRRGFAPAQAKEMLDAKRLPASSGASSKANEFSKLAPARLIITRSEAENRPRDGVP